MKHSELRHQPRHVNPRIQVLLLTNTIHRFSKDMSAGIMTKLLTL